MTLDDEVAPQFRSYVGGLKKKGLIIPNQHVSGANTGEREWKDKTYQYTPKFKFPDLAHNEPSEIPESPKRYISIND